MSKIRVAGIDPSFCNTAIVAGTYDLDTGIFEVDASKLIQTKKTTVKSVRVVSDDVERVHKIIYELQPLLDVSMVFVETPTGSQNASGMKNFGICVALIAWLRSRVPVVQVTPMEVKVSATGNKKASKQEMIDWAYATYPGVDWPMYRGSPAKKSEHLADACGTIAAGLKSEQWNQLISFLKDYDGNSK